MAEYLDIAQPVIKKNPHTGEYLATPYFEDYLQRLVVATGGEGSDSVTQALSASLEADKIPYLTGLVLALKKKVSTLEASFATHIIEAAVKQLQIDTARFDTKIKTVNYTAKNKEYIEGRNGITLKFPENAVSGDEVIFANGDGSSITFDGNGNNIKYTELDMTMISQRKGSSFHFHFFEDNILNERYWRVK